MWDVTDKLLENSIRHGDILMESSRNPTEKHHFVDMQTVVVGGSNEIRSTEMYEHFRGEDVEDVIAW